MAPKLRYPGVSKLENGRRRFQKAAAWAAQTVDGRKLKFHVEFGRVVEYDINQVIQSGLFMP